MIKTMTRLLMIACLVLPFAACKKQEATQEAVKPPMSAPTTDDRQAWVDYLNDVVPRHMAGIPNQPYVYLLPGESAPDFQDQYDRMLEKAQGDVARGIISGNMLAYASPASAKMADLVIAAFNGVPVDSMKGVRVVFIGKSGDSARVQTAVAPAGVDYVFVDTGK
jgi:hypothetical protein